MRWGVCGKVDEGIMLFEVWFLLWSIIGFEGVISFFFDMVVMIIWDVELFCIINNNLLKIIIIDVYYVNICI